jgi:hypothetical protein
VTNTLAYFTRRSKKKVFINAAVRSERDVKVLEKIISNLYGRENPFNLLTKRHGPAAAGTDSKKSVKKLEKRFAKHLSQLYKDGTDIGLIRHHEG